MLLLILKQLFLRKCEGLPSLLKSRFSRGFLSERDFRCAVTCTDSSYTSTRSAPFATPTRKPFIICSSLAPSLKAFGAKQPPPLLLFIRTVFPLPSLPPTTKLRDIGTKTSRSLPSSYPDPSLPPPLPMVAGNFRKVVGFTHNLKELVRVIPPTTFFELGTPPTHMQQARPSQSQAVWDYLLKFGKCSIYKGDCQNFGRKSRFLVSGPGIGVMLVTKRDSPRFSRKFGAGPVMYQFGACYYCLKF
ncbi:PREDICTED: uncharacterized protein LOC103322425 isoform X1 [Prunus mume]|uniref:Uncharacterized protein LOC103322425 isoform X1 n=1 Tax=Prunus mume TaxID=102107 RepID=A0ABM1LHK2_PRUMU|nr:PREDICTED: uncharacterized protein LOC103322425 isoform X1 [Prunus mume]XP_016646878.1 PREDICTED: uncharacterized protein LOC103322425 isoform X1 [Prunus mume]XP_016646879.1 PREDICTED: uncharacterized protein LOC103322425 isoform X1 [Prunus mume]